MRIPTVMLALLLTAGVVPDGMGAWVSSGRGIIPTASTIMRWRYDPQFDAVWRDRIMWAVASVDYELPSIRLLYSLTDSPSPYQFHFDFDDSPAPPECTDDVPGNCTVARTTCGVGGALVGSAYRMCDMLRVQVYIRRIEAVAQRQGVPTAEYAHAVLRHEVSHVLGLPEVYAIGGAPVGACARALLEGFVVDANPWTFTPRPDACN